MPSSRLEEIVQALKPESLLDVGCGCGRHLTSLLPRHCARVFAIDVVARASSWQKLSHATGISFCCMDAAALAFARNSFPLVLQRDSLHHMARWRDAFAEMLRVSSGHVLLEEPVDDLRSPAKRRTYEAQGLMLALQAEVGYSHYKHLHPETLLSLIRSQARILDVNLDRHDTDVIFDEFFESYSEFASRSGREGYWLGRLDELRSRFDGANLCEDDRLTVLVAKNGSQSSQ